MDYDKNTYYGFIWPTSSHYCFIRLEDGAWNTTHRTEKSPGCCFSRNFIPEYDLRLEWNKHANPLGWNMTEKGIEKIQKEDKTVNFIITLILDDASPNKLIYKIRQSDGYYSRIEEQCWNKPDLGYSINIEAYNKAAKPLGWQLDNESNLKPVKYTFCELIPGKNEFVPEKELFRLTEKEFYNLFFTNKNDKLVQKYEQPISEQITSFLDNKIKEIQRSTRELGYCPNHSMEPLTIQFRTLGTSTTVLIATCLECQKKGK